MKSLVRRFIESFGYSVAKVPPTLFPELIETPRYQECVVHLDGHPFRVADSHSFLHSYQEIFEQGIYEFPTDSANPRIVDCGSNYGTSVVYFKKKYPSAVITAVECDPVIHGLLTSNVQQRGLHDVTILNKAVSTTSGTVKFNREGADAGRIGTVHGDGETVEVETIALDSLIDQPTDFLKVDIEGEESDVLCHAQNLGNVQAMFVEYHSFDGQPQKLSDLLGKLTSSGFRYFIQTQYCAERPLMVSTSYLGMDLQLNLFAVRSQEG